MSGISGVGSGASTASQTSATTQTPLQRAMALAQQAKASGHGLSTQSTMRLAQSALGAELVGALNAGSTGSSSDTSLANSLYGNSSSDSSSSSVADQLGALFKNNSPWQQIQTPNARSPGISKTVPLSQQISYEQVVTPSDESRSHASPNLGTIGNNSGRLVLMGSLSDSQSDVQTFTFNLQAAGQLHILAPDPNSNDPTASLGDVHMQVLDSKGTVMADSDPKSGAAYLNYVKLDQSIIAGADFHAGQYTLKLSYNSAAPANAKGDYSLFIEEGTDPGRTTFYTTTDSLNNFSSSSKSTTGSQVSVQA